MQNIIMNKILAFLLCFMCYVGSYSQTTQTWYDFLNSNIRAEGEYVINNDVHLDTLGELRHIRPKCDQQGKPMYVDQYGPLLHRPIGYEKPNKKVLVLWEDSKRKISNMEFDGAENIGLNTIQVRIGNKFGVIDTNGGIILKPEYAMIEGLDPIVTVENQLFYIAQDSSGRDNHLWEIRNRNGDLVFDGTNPEMNPFFGKFGGIKYLYLNKRVHYAIEITPPYKSTSGNVITTAIGEINGQPKYLLPGGLEFIGSRFDDSDFPFLRYESYISLGMSKLEQECLTKINATIFRAEPNSNRKRFLFNDLRFFNLSLGREIEDKDAFDAIYTGWDFIFSLSDPANYEVKRYHYIRRCAKDYELKLDSNYSTDCGQYNFALLDNELNQIIPFSNLELKQFRVQEANIKQRSILEHFIKTLKSNANTSRKSRGLFHLEYGTILDPEYNEIEPLLDIYRPEYDGKFWEVELKSGFKKVYNFEKRAFVLEGKEFDSISAKQMNAHQKFYGVLDGVEFEIF